MNDHPDKPFHKQEELHDVFSRTISYLRLSLTDRCNLRCHYCVTGGQESGSFEWLGHQDLFSYEELLRVVRVATSMGVSKVRLTGGEPLIRRNVMYFIRQLNEINGLDDIRITTNGVLLEKRAEDLLAAGIRKVNISLDSLKPERFREITGKDCFGQVWSGIGKALDTGFSAVKLNMVVVRGINDDELLDFAGLSLKYPLQVRFIEFMPIGSSTRWSKEAFVPSDEIIDRISRLGKLHPLERNQADGPARTYMIGEGAPGSLGFISPMSNHFCGSCNRIRLTSDGKLRPCLLSDQEIDLKAVVRGGGSDDDIRKAILSAVTGKPEGHRMAGRLGDQVNDCNGLMSRIGG